AVLRLADAGMLRPFFVGLPLENGAAIAGGLDAAWAHRPTQLLGFEAVMPLRPAVAQRADRRSGVSVLRKVRMRCQAAKQCTVASRFSPQWPLCWSPTSRVGMDFKSFLRHQPLH